MATDICIYIFIHTYMYFVSFSLFPFLCVPPLHSVTPLLRSNGTPLLRSNGFGGFPLLHSLPSPTLRITKFLHCCEATVLHCCEAMFFFSSSLSPPGFSHAHNTSVTPLLRSNGIPLLQSNVFCFTLFHPVLHCCEAMALAMCFTYVPDNIGASMHQS